MKPLSVMFIAGETSGDRLAAELALELRQAIVDQQFSLTPDPQPLTATLEPRFFGAGGPAMAKAGVQLAFDLTQHATVGLWEVAKRYPTFRRLFLQLVSLARAHTPDAIILVDFSSFNLRFARAIKRQVRSFQGSFNDWNPRLIYFVSPQVWASRSSRIYQIARDIDLMLTIFPFEKDWYARRIPALQVEFVGHPIVDRYATDGPSRTETAASSTSNESPSPAPLVLLLPGSRERELELHLPVMIEAVRQIRQSKSIIAKIVLPSAKLERLTQTLNSASDTPISTQIGGLPESLRHADLAIAASGTVTLECAYFRVPTVVLYKTSWLTYQVGKRLVQVNHLAMPNLLAGEELFPEFIQDAATPANLSRAALQLLDAPARRQSIRQALDTIAQSLGPLGACRRAAQAIVRLVLPQHRAPQLSQPE